MSPMLAGRRFSQSPASRHLRRLSTAPGAPGGACGIEDGRGSVVIIRAPQKPKLEQIFTCQRPVLFRGLAKKWKAMSWLDQTSSSYMRNRLNLAKEDVIVPMEFGDYMQGESQKGHVGLDSVFDTLEVEMGMNKEDRKLALRWYVAQHELKDISPTLLEDVETPDLCLTTGKKTIYRNNFWLNGAAGSSSPCHNDPFNNMLVQLHGEKEVTLFDDKSAEALYLASDTVQKNTSTIPFAKYEEEGTGEVDIPPTDFPLYHEAGKKTQYGPVTMMPGDALYIPFKYYHWCRAHGPSLSVNWWWL